MVRFCLVGAAAVAAGFASVAGASPIHLGGASVPLTASVGTGENTSYLVLDFDHTAGGVYAFAYRWSGAATAEQMLRALDDSPLDFTLQWTEWSPGNFTLDRIDFGTDASTDTASGTQGLAFFNWDGDGWTDPWVGVSETQLAGDQADVADPATSTWVLGFRQSWYDTGETNEWGPIWAIEAPPAAVVAPEPATLALVGIALAAVARRRTA